MIAMARLEPSLPPSALGRAKRRWPALSARRRISARSVLPFVPRLAVIVPVGAGMLAAMVEEADIVVLPLERPDLALDEGVELNQIRRDIGGNVEIHGPFLR